MLKIGIYHNQTLVCSTNNFAIYCTFLVNLPITDNPLEASHIQRNQKTAFCNSKVNVTTLLGLVGMDG